ncbi:uncharacterized protein A4U43_C04F35380 [Asparagus officinalis]|uniref:Flavin-containing monooxygenase n=1 Tax=Asparagus officinalis TaxID=4686 RepID=A0A5P1FAI9_ASPOF|nr:uncharacterized protein A4U43_C04F35380 [Asparagus officinalis]
MGITVCRGSPRLTILVIIGKGASAHDISRELSKVAKEVHLASRSPDFKVGKLDGYNNIWQHLMIKNVNEDGLVVFDDGSSLHADTILHCTGYKYHFPFLDTKETVSVDDNRVGPLYKHVFPPHLAPYLSFVGLLSKVIIFMSIDLQAKWVARVLSGKISLPPEDEMVASMDEYYFQMEEIGKPKRHTHELYPDEVEHLNWLTAEVGLPPLEDWRFQIYRTVLRRISAHDDNYRDNLDVDSLIQHSLPRAVLGGEFDLLLLDEMYSQPPNRATMGFLDHVGRASSVALPKATPMLALPAPPRTSVGGEVASRDLSAASV